MKESTAPVIASGAAMRSRASLAAVKHAPLARLIAHVLVHSRFDERRVDAVHAFDLAAERLQRQLAVADPLNHFVPEPTTLSQPALNQSVEASGHHIRHYHAVNSSLPC